VTTTRPGWRAAPTLACTPASVSPGPRSESTKKPVSAAKTLRMASLAEVMGSVLLTVIVSDEAGVVPKPWARSEVVLV